MKNERLVAYALIALGVIILLSRLGNADWLWIALLSIVFLLGYVARKSYGFLVAGSVLMGVAVGTLLDTQSGMLLSLAVSFFAIDRIERRPNRWPIYTAGIFAVLGGLSALGAAGLLSSVGFAILLIIGGGYLIYREQGKTELQPQRRAYGSSTAPEGTTSTPSPTEARDAPSATAPDVATVGDEAAAATTPDAPTPAAATSAPEVHEAVSASPSAQPSAATPPPPAAEGKHVAEVEERLQRLEAWRKKTADNHGTPPYIVFSNDTLFRIASSNPQTLSELAAVKGVGPVKLERYGQTVLAVLRGNATSDTETPAA